MTSAREILKNFDIASMPDLDTAVLGALELFEAEPPCQQVPVAWDRVLVVGSGNARATGEILFRDMDAVYADESSVEETLARSKDIGGAVLISASGGKHAAPIAELLASRDIPTVLLTNNPNPKAGEFLKGGTVVVFPKNREPYTYNTSTYLGMILSNTREDAEKIREHIETEVAKLAARDFAKFSAFVFILPPEFRALTAMVRTKFDELFGPFVNGRVFTSEEVKHAKTVITSPKECVISIGVANDAYGLRENRVSVPLPDEAEYGAALAVAYYVVGCIQRQHPPYFKNNIIEYTSNMSRIFNERIDPIVG